MRIPSISAPVTITVLVILSTATTIAAQSATDTLATTTNDFNTPSVSTSRTIQLLSSATTLDATTSSGEMVLGAQNTSTSTPTTGLPPAPLVCVTSYTTDLYNTPNGHATSGAVVVGTQSWTDCTDENGNTYEFKITPDQYRVLSLSGATSPIEFASSTFSLDSHVTGRLPAPVQAPTTQNAQASQLVLGATSTVTDNASSTASDTLISTTTEASDEAGTATSTND